MGLATDIMDILSTGGVSTPKFGGDMPERPVIALCVTQTAGLGSTHTMGSLVGAPVLESMQFQVRARAADYASAETIMNNAHSKLDGLRSKVINGQHYQYIASLSTPLYLGTDEEERPLFACNYRAQRTLT